MARHGQVVKGREWLGSAGKGTARLGIDGGVAGSHRGSRPRHPRGRGTVRSGKEESGTAWLGLGWKAGRQAATRVRGPGVHSGMAGIGMARFGLAGFGMARRGAVRICEGLMAGGWQSPRFETSALTLGWLGQAW